MRVLRLCVSPGDDGMPVRALARARLQMSYAQFKSAKFNGALLLDGERVHADRRARAGQTLEIYIPEDTGGARAGDAPSALVVSVAPRVVYEDAALLIVDKPAPLPSIRARLRDAPTLEDWALAYLAPATVYRPLNRLDKGTSGLMVIAKHAHEQQLMQRALHGDAFIREYLAVCEGAPPAPSGVIDLPIGKADGATVRREIRTDGRDARTHYTLLQTADGLSLLRLRLDTGRTHQIRVHLAAVGCPVVGDFLYGRESPALPGRFALHSAYIRLVHPLTGAPLACESALPEGLRALMGDAGALPRTPAGD